MKTYEWIIKIVSYILCCAAVCAGFSAKERAARDTLDEYIESAQERETSKLCELMIRLKNGVARCVSDGAESGDFAEVSYCCKAASDLVSSVNGGRGSEALRLFFNRVKSVCDAAYEDPEKAAPIQRQPVSELYMRLSAIEDSLLSGKTSAPELIAALSSGLSVPAEKEERTDRISVSKAEKYAYGYIGNGIRLKNCGIYGGRFIFASPRSCILLTNKGEPLIKSRTVTEGRERVNQASAAQIAENYVYGLTGKPCKAEFDDKLFGIYYFSIVCDEKKYPVGVDKTDGSIVFYVISQ